MMGVKPRLATVIGKEIIKASEQLEANNLDGMKDTITKLMKPWLDSKNWDNLIKNITGVLNRHLPRQVMDEVVKEAVSYVVYIPTDNYKESLIDVILEKTKNKIGYEVQRETVIRELISIKRKQGCEAKIIRSLEVELEMEMDDQLVFIDSEPTPDLHPKFICGESLKDDKKASYIIEFAVVVFSRKNWKTISEEVWFFDVPDDLLSDKYETAKNLPNKMDAWRKLKQPLDEQGNVIEAKFIKLEKEDSQLHEVYQRIHNKKVLGYNVKIDLKWLVNTYRLAQDSKAPTPYSVVDLLPLLKNCLISTNAELPPNFKLDSMSQYFGFGRQLHRLLEDIKALVKVFNVMARNMFLAESFKNCKANSETEKGYNLVLERVDELEKVMVSRFDEVERRVDEVEKVVLKKMDEVLQSLSNMMEIVKSNKDNV